MGLMKMLTGLHNSACPGKTEQRQVGPWLGRGDVTTVLAKRLCSTLCVAALGWIFAVVVGIHGLDSSSGYFHLAVILLAVGLFSSTYEITIAEIRKNANLVLVAVTLGVLVKTALIAGLMYAVFRDPTYIVLGVVVAQIDPLSVAAMRDQSRLSERTKDILSAWSAFDDPVTAIIAVYLSAIALALSENQTITSVNSVENPAATAITDSLSSLGNGLLGNVLLVVCAAAIWVTLQFFAKRNRRSITDDPNSNPKSRVLQFVAFLFLTLATVVAVNNFLMLGLATLGLFFRPGIKGALSRSTHFAFFISVWILGLLLIDGVDLFPGLILGCAAFISQMIVGRLVTTGKPFSKPERWRLMLGQQSGITAVILALLLETILPGTVAVVAPAILVINTLHLIANALCDKLETCTEKISEIKDFRQSETEPPANIDTPETKKLAQPAMPFFVTPP